MPGCRAIVHDGGGRRLARYNLLYRFVLLISSLTLVRVMPDSAVAAGKAGDLSLPVSAELRLVGDPIGPLEPVGRRGQQPDIGKPLVVEVQLALRSLT